MYLYTEVHNVLFLTFRCELHECLLKLVDREATWNHDDPIIWTLELVKRLEASDYNLARAVDYKIDSILGSFLAEFAIDTSVSYREDENQFFKGWRGK